MDLPVELDYDPFLRMLCTSMGLERDRGGSWERKIWENEPLAPFTEVHKYENVGGR